MNTKWEHKVLTFKLGWKGFDYEQMEQDLSEFGRQGWEALDTIAPGLGSGGAVEIVVILKRARA